MPGMMDTVLNLGLNDETVEGLAQALRRRALRLRQLSPLHPDVLRRRARTRARRVRGNPRLAQGHCKAISSDTEMTADDWKQVVARIQARRGARARQAVPVRSEGAALGRHRRGVRKLDERSRDLLSQAQQHPRKLGHRRQRAGDGVRQYGRHVAPPASRSRAIPRTGEKKFYGEYPHQRARRGRRRRHPHAEAR